MSAQSFEITLARLYTNPAFRKGFLENPKKALSDCDLTASECQDLLDIDKAGLLLASRSFYHKRKKRIRRPTLLSSLAKRLSRFFIAEKRIGQKEIE